MYSLATFYQSKDWTAFREVLINDRIDNTGQIICEYCHKPIVKAYDIIAHHKEELTEDNINNVEVSLNPENISLVHHICHNHIHDKLGYRAKKVYMIYGPPFSGKSQYVQGVIESGDIVINIDDIWQCLSGMDRYNKDGRLNACVFKVRDTLLECIRYRLGKWNNAYIVGGYPLTGERERICKELGAEALLIDTTHDECIRRLDEYNGIIDKLSYKKYIDDWFDKHRAPTL